jgi:hypothetical protein
VPGIVLALAWGMARAQKQDAASRTTADVFNDHIKKRLEGRLEEDIKQNYAENVVLLTCMGTYRGHDGLRESNKILEESLPKAKIEYTNQLVDGEFAFLEWRGTNGEHEVPEGADSFVIRDGKIRWQAIHYKIHPCK